MNEASTSLDCDDLHVVPSPDRPRPSRSYLQKKGRRSGMIGTFMRRALTHPYDHQGDLRASRKGAAINDLGQMVRGMGSVTAMMQKKPPR